MALVVAVPVTPTGDAPRMVAAPVAVMICPANGVNSTMRNTLPLTWAWNGIPLNSVFSADTRPARLVVAVFSVIG
ncbi:hypothetical protein D3C76_748870 [compost metagenome]